MSRRFRTRQNARPWADPNAFREPDDDEDPNLPEDEQGEWSSDDEKEQ